MDCVNCECTVKTMDNLEGAIRQLMQRGKSVDKMMNDERKIRAAKKREEVDELKRCLAMGKKEQKMQMVDSEPETNTRESTNNALLLGTISEEPTMADSQFGNQLKPATETVEFEVPSLNYEESSACSFVSAARGVDPDAKKKQKKKKKKSSSCCSSSSTYTYTKTSSSIQSSRRPRRRRPEDGGQLTLHEHYVVDRDGRSELFPLKVHLKRSLDGDGALDVLFQFLDQNHDKIMEILVRMCDNRVMGVTLDGQEL